MAYATVTVAAPGAIDNVTVNVSEVVPLLPSATAASLIDSVGTTTTAAWFTVNVCPAMLMVPERAAPVLA